MFVLDQITINLNNPGQRQRIYASLGDSETRAVQVKLITNAGEWLIPDDISCVTRFTKADGHKGVYYKMPDGGEAWSISGSVLTLKLAPQVLTCPGLVELSAALVRGTERLGLFSFEIHVAHDPLVDMGESSDYFTLDNLEQINSAFAGLSSMLTAGIARCISGVESTDHPGCYYRDVGNTIEWINPPMMLGVEYRTAQRWDGSAVFTKIVDIGVLPASSAKQIQLATGVGNGVVLDSVLVVKRNANGFTFAHDDSDVSYYLANYGGAISIMLDTTVSSVDMSAYSARVLIQYTKL